MVAGSMPYEKASEFVTWKLQKQIYYHDYTFHQWFSSVIHSIKSKCKGWKFRRGYYLKGGKIYNKYTDKPYYIHDSKGTYIVQGRPCSPDCKYCKQTVVTYPEYVLKVGDVK